MLGCVANYRSQLNVHKDLVFNLLLAVQVGLNNRYEDIRLIRWCDMGYDELAGGEMRPFIEAGRTPL